MSDVRNEQSEDEILHPEISDASLEKAACLETSGAYTQFANCTFMACPL